jgi:hypothetical protein
MKFYEIPPKCLSQFDSILLESEEFRSKFGINCPCGYKQGELIGYFVEKPAFSKVSVFVSPICFHCSHCNCEIEIFDSKKHGYNFEIGSRSVAYHSVDYKKQFQCRSCGSTFFTPLVEFNYDDDILEDCNVDKNRIQEFYFSFAVYGTCTNCHSIELMSELSV